jgi:hypothetical protein
MIFDWWFRLWEPQESMLVDSWSSCKVPIHFGAYNPPPLLFHKNPQPLFTVLLWVSVSVWVSYCVKSLRGQDAPVCRHSKIPWIVSGIGVCPRDGSRAGPVMHWLMPQSLLPPYPCISFFFCVCVIFFSLLRIFLNDISNAIPKVPHNLPPTSLPTHSHFLALAFPCISYRQEKVWVRSFVDGLVFLLLLWVSCLATSGTLFRFHIPNLWVRAKFTPIESGMHPLFQVSVTLYRSALPLHLCQLQIYIHFHAHLAICLCTWSWIPITLPISSTTCPPSIPYDYFILPFKWDSSVLTCAFLFV